MGDTSVLVGLYEKVKGVSIFDLRAYIEPAVKIGPLFWSMLTNILVNLLFSILNLLVGLISILLRFFEDFSLYDAYKQTVYDSSKALWKQLTGAGDYTNSLVYIVIAITALAIFLSYLFSKGDVAQRLLRLMVLIMLGLGYFGTVKQTSGGLYVLDTIHTMANEASKAISSVSIENPTDKEGKIESNQSIADHYIAKTSYAAYLYVNTGRLDGKYYDNQTGELVDFDDSKILGSVDEKGNFQKVNVKERDKELDSIGDKANEGMEKNRWVSAVFDYIFIKFFYVFFKIVEAVVIGVPLLMIQMIKFLAELVVIVSIVGFPLAFLVALFPSMEHVVFNVMKLMLGGSIFPALTGFLTLMVFYIESLVSKFVSDGFKKEGLDLSSFKDYLPLFELMISTVLQGIILVFIWKNKENILSFLLGNRNARTVSQLANHVGDMGHRLGTNIYDRAGDFAYSGAYALGAGAGLALSAKDGFDYLMSAGGMKPFGTHTGAMEGQVYDKEDSNGAYLPPSESVYIGDGVLVDNVDDMVSDTAFDDTSFYSENNGQVEPQFEEGLFYSDSYGDTMADSDYQERRESADTFESYQDHQQFQQDHFYGYSGEPFYSKADVTFENADSNTVSGQPPSSEESGIEPFSDYKFYKQKLKEEKKINRLEEELSNYQQMADLSRLNAVSPFKRGVAKVTSRKRQYEMNVKRARKIEQKLAELRGESA